MKINSYYVSKVHDYGDHCQAVPEDEPLPGETGIPCTVFWSIYAVDDEGLSFAVGDWTDKATADGFCEAMNAPLLLAQQRMRTE